MRSGPPPELKDKVEKRGLNSKFEYFRFLTTAERRRKRAAEMCRRFDAGLPAEQIFAK